jgi:subtilisin family serine protease
MAKLDVRLNSLLARKSAYERDPSAAASSFDRDRPLHVAVKFRGDVAPLRAAGFAPQNVYGSVAYGTANLDVLERLNRLPSVLSMETQARRYVQLHDSVPEIGASSIWARAGDTFSGYTGSGVIVGIIDTGIDFRHPNFIAPDGTSRIMYIWDQTLTAEGWESAPAPITAGPFAAALDYGVLYHRDDLTAAIQSETPERPVRHADEEGHGTNVAGIAAGNGRQASTCHGPYRYIGVSPHADIIAVRQFGLTHGDRGEKQDPPANPPLAEPSSSLTEDALRFIFEKARVVGAPVVINCSFGAFSSDMDGSAAVCVDVDNLLNSNSQGRAVVWGAGNDADADFHAAGTVPASGSFELEFKIYGSDTDERYLVIVYSGSNLELRVTSPVGGVAGTVGWVSVGATGGPSSTANGTIAGGSPGEVQVDNDANRMTISIRPPKHPAATAGGAQPNGDNVGGSWKIELRNTTATPTAFNAFCEGGSSYDRKSPKFLDHTTSNSTLTLEASGAECITVGSYKVGGQLAAWSARGPTLDGRTKPELGAPGVDVTTTLSAATEEGHCHFCCCKCCREWYAGMEGTSIAAPHVTGAVALMLHKNPNLTHTEIKALLTSHADGAPSDAPPADLPGWGAGKLSAMNSVNAAPLVNAPLPRIAAPPEIVETPLLERFLLTRYGQAYYDLAEEYFGEILALVQANKKVATVWHRNRGPGWTRVALNAFFNPELKIPLTLGGLDLKESLDRFLVVLKRHASPRLRADLERCEGQLDLLREGMTLLDLLEAVGDRPLPLELRPKYGS